MTMQLTPTADEEVREVALLKAIGLDRLPPEQRELAISIANKYDLDLLLKHLVLIDGRAYITRDGLLHVAHKSGQFDGIETTDPVLTAGYWRSTCSVYRKDMGRPFTYTGRYPEAGRNKAYAPEMAIKVGEVMALRRAFDVSAPAYEERWTESAEPSDEPEKPSSLTDLVEQKAAALSPADEAVIAATTYATTTPVTQARVVTFPTPADVRPVVGSFAGVEPIDVLAQTAAPDEVTDAVTLAHTLPPAKTAPAPEIRPETADEQEVAVSVREERESPPQGISLEGFLSATHGYKRDEVRAVAKSMYPGMTASKLSDPQRYALLEQVRADLHKGPVDPAGVALCEVRSPLSGAACDYEEGHAGRHLDAPGSEAW